MTLNATDDSVDLSTTCFRTFFFVFWLYWWIYPPALESHLSEVLV